MRPDTLTFAGLRSYSGRTQTIDFTGKSLVAILGNTGAGKSTILEAIVLALYAKPSWRGSKSRQLIAEGTTTMSVELTFTHEGEQWQVNRTYSSKDNSDHSLRNLNTGQEWDGQNNVDERIKTLLKLQRPEFLSAVLLPQGKFDQLLNASPTERTDLLKSIFGTQALSGARELAVTRRERIDKLVNQAKLARTVYPADPATTAKEAAKQAEDAQNRAKRLDQARATLRTLQQEAAELNVEVEVLRGVKNGLAEQRLPDLAVLLEVEQAEQELTAAKSEAVEQESQATDRKNVALASIEEAARSGVSTESLNRAQRLLNALPKRIEELIDTKSRLAAWEQKLDEEGQRLAQADDDIRTLQAKAATRRELADTARERERGALQAIEALELAGREALLAALNVARRSSDTKGLTAELAALTERLPALETALDGPRELANKAHRRLDTVLRAEAAHSAGLGLTPGDACSVCAQPLPADYRPPAPLDNARLDEARSASSQADSALQTAIGKLTSAQGKIDTVGKQLTAATAVLDEARERLARRLSAVTAAVAGIVAADDPGVPGAVGDRIIAAATAATHTSSASLPDEAEISTQATELCGPITESIHTLRKEHHTAVQEAVCAEKQAEANALIRDKDRKQLTENTRRLGDERVEHMKAIAVLEQEFRALPAAIVDGFPAEPMSLTPEHLAIMATRCGEYRVTLDQLDDRLRQADDDLHAIENNLRALDQRHDSQVVQPLAEFGGVLSASNAALDRLHRLLNPETEEQPVVLTKPLTAAALREAHRDTQEQASQLRDEAERRSTDTSAKLTRVERRLAGTVTKIKSGPDGAAVQFAEGVHATEPAFTDPLSAAIGAARQTANEQQALAATATAQIDPAAALDHAIEQGSTRSETLFQLHKLLADGKFVSYLTNRRTQALLRLGDELFSRLSSGRYGFSADFQIVNLTTGTTRHPKTLSGGETFLASLALALALVELHSRNGARLGSLFLDEGFGSLDSSALASALSVLHRETGPDRLVTVISHLHPVAEAVDDVLWIDRTPTGSQARWLTPPERAALIDDAARSGLLTLPTTDS